MNWHLRSASEVWALEESDYIIRLGRRFWDRRDATGRYTGGVAEKALRRTQPASYSTAGSKGAVKLFDPATARASHQAILYQMALAIEEDVAPDDSIREMKSMLQGDSPASDAKAMTARSIAEIAAQDPAVIEAHGRWARGLTPSNLAVLSQNGTKLPQLIRRSDASFEMRLTRSQVRQVTQRQKELPPTEQTHAEAVRLFRELTITSRYPKALLDDSWRQLEKLEKEIAAAIRGGDEKVIQSYELSIAARKQLIKDQQMAIRHLADLRDNIKPSDPDFTKKVEDWYEEYGGKISGLNGIDYVESQLKTNEALMDLASDPAFMMETLVNQMLSSWAESSWNGTLSDIMQHIAREEFGVENEFWRDDAYDLPRRIDQIEDENPDVLVLMRSALRAMYSATQEVLAEAGGDTVMLYRGIKDDNRGRAEGKRMIPSGDITVSMGPLSSWSLDPDTAWDFAGNGHILIANVPKERIIATPVTGIGCLSEFEMIVIGGDLDVHALDMYGTTVSQTLNNTMTVQGP